ncbi:MAG: Rieske 2Fe-2S domain-containing protein [Planctomycetaceae bacterium]|nr:Rieske 2Fe-2S domain-containing protein [Planctomycetaceae bacterium]
MSHKPPSPATGEISDFPRRGFMTRLLALVIGGLTGLLPAIPAISYFIDPLTRKKRAVGLSDDDMDPEGFIKVASQDALSEDGMPRSFKVIADMQDFWNKFPDTEVGAVYLRKESDGQISCFNARCPHLGCTVKFEDASQTYVCPCHASAFSMTGERTNSIPPRNLDKLDAEVREDGMVWVKFQKYRAGIKEQVVV